MKPVRFKKIIQEKEFSSLLLLLETPSGKPIVIRDIEGKAVFGEPDGNSREKFPIHYRGEIIGYYECSRQVPLIDKMISIKLDQEDEKKTLINETLERYKEITLLYNLGEKLSSQLDVGAVSRMIVEEVMHHIHGENASVMKFDEKSQSLEILAAGGNYTSGEMLPLKAGIGIAGSIFRSGQGEIVNETSKDPRYLPGKYKVHSMMCAPMKVKDKVIGVVNISTREPHNYTSADLKLFTAIVMQAAFAMENSILYENKLQEQKIKNNLERYISAQVVEAIINSNGEVSLDPMKQEITVLFSDIRNFTLRCEKLPPEKIVNYLNEYFSAMVDVIFAKQGTINKFVGDMIVALFGAPTKIEAQEHQAVRAAIEMQKILKDFPNEWIRDNFHTGIGINSGDVIVGNIGSRQHMDYTAIGDPVNVASRLQGLAKAGQILVSESIYNKTKDEFEYRKFHEVVTLKGRQEPVQIYEVIY